MKKETEAYILEHYKGTSAKRMAKECEQFEKISEKIVLRFYHKMGISSGLDGRYKKGQTSPNKGRKRNEWMSPDAQKKMKSYQFKKGHHLHEKPIGTITDKGNKIVIKIGEKKWVPMQRKVWMEHYGEIPRGYQIIHLDKDYHNNDISNLAMITRKEAMEMNGRIGLSNNKELNETIINLARLNVAVRGNK